MCVMIVTDKCRPACTFQEFRPFISKKNPHGIIHLCFPTVEIEGNLERNELKILHYLIAFTYGRAEQPGLLSYGRGEQTLKNSAAIIE